MALTIRPDTICVNVTATMWVRVRTIPHTTLAQALESAKDSRLIQGRVTVASAAILDKIESHLRNSRKAALDYAVRVPSLRLYLARESVLPRIEAAVADARTTLTEMLAELQVAWPRIVASAMRPISEGGLAEVAKPNWYPTNTDELLKSYDLRLDVIRIQITTDLAERIATEAREELRATLASIISGLIERLETGQRLRTDTFDALRQFVATFSARDISQDSELAAIVEQSKRVLEIIPRKIDNSNKDLRQSVAQMFKAIDTQMANLLTPERSFVEDEG